MKLLSVQVGRPRKVQWRRRTVTTGIYKDPVEGRIKLRPHQLRRGRASRSESTWRMGQGGLCLSIRALCLLAHRASRLAVAVRQFR